MTKPALRSSFFGLFVLIVLAGALASCSSPEEKAQNYYARGQELLKNKEYAKAGLEYRNAIQLKKNMVEAWRGLFEVEVHSGDGRNLATILRNIVDLDPSDEQAKLKLARLLFAGNDLEHALELVDAARKQQPNDADVLALRAGILFKQGNATEAHEQAEDALKLDPSKGQALVVLAAEKLKQGDFPGALEVIHSHPKAVENDLGVQILQLQILEKLGDKSAFESQLQKIVSANPKSVQFREDLVRFYLREKRFEDAERELRLASTTDPSNVKLGLELVRLIQQVKGPAVAREELVARSQGGEQAFKYKLALADFDFDQGRTDDAIKQLQGLINGQFSKQDVTSARIELARLQLQMKNEAAASDLVAAVLKDDQRNVDALALQATILLNRGNYEGAINDLRQALNDQPRSSDLMLLLATAYERGGSTELAEKEYPDAVRASNFKPEVVLAYVAFLRRKGNSERAEEVLHDASQRQPNNIQLLSALAQVRLERQNWSGAQEVAEALQKIDGAQNIGDEVLAASLSGRGQFDQSIQLLKNLSTAAPNAPLLNDVVTTMIRAGKLDDATSFLRAALKSNPNNIEALVLLGSIEFRKGQIDDTERSFQSAIEKAKKNPAGYVALARLRITQKKLADAENVLRSGLTQLPQNIPLHESLANVFVLQGQIDAAIKEFEWLLKEQPGSLVAANNLASLLSEYRTDKASLDRAYSVAVMLNKSPVPSFQDTLGWLYFLRGDSRAATKLLEPAAKALPNRAVVQYHLGMVYSADGQGEKAREQFNRALSLNPDQQLEAKIKTALEKK